MIALFIGFLKSKCIFPRGAANKESHQAQAKHTNPNYSWVDKECWVRRSFIPKLHFKTFPNPLSAVEPQISAMN